ncbi:MAG TPA: oxidoreductase, partial [Burkholderiaceae bacterium]|nr:oxidoreductase [Burkholderiaceae bacterium]
MTPAPLVAATLEFDAEGVAFSSRYGDRYHPRAGALQQARHVFLHGNGLPERWRGQDGFTILETGFGLGNNFLATLAAWRADAQRCERLHYLAVERHPFSRGDLARAHAACPLQGSAGELSAAWPPPTPDLHRLAFEAGRVQLLPAFGVVADWLPGIVAPADATYPDGFSLPRNRAIQQYRTFNSSSRPAS